MARIGFFELEGWERPVVEAQLADAGVFFSTDPITPLCLPDAHEFEILCIFVNSRITKEVFDCFPNLKLIATRSTGFDHIDLAEARRRGVAISSVPGYGSHTVAEYTFGLILALTRKIYQSIDQVKETGSFSLDALRGVELHGKRLGIVGMGKIGREVARIAHGFGMQVCAFDPHPDTETARSLGFSYAGLEELLRGSDIVSLHCPHTPETHYLINKKNISLMKKGSFLINTARGSVVETDALIEGLRSGLLSGAALDVLEEEGETRDELDFLAFGHPNEEHLRTMLQNHILMRMPNVLITPHNAFNAQEALERILATSIANITAFRNGAPNNLVS